MIKEDAFGSDPAAIEACWKSRIAPPFASTASSASRQQLKNGIQVDDIRFISCSRIVRRANLISLSNSRQHSFDSTFITFTTGIPVQNKPDTSRLEIF
ncbi:hypothetical protein HRR86_000223 [Exophiala dermatitidis]|nr:hypothetical protein HRR74_000271 [Exophiala dermatitidis]KAJ4558256.1 hypothetical protein HRR77_000270 [Exophiala dermatitidis]KAJ4581706.1 hypothetical protein HRR79_000723 [Exophiala dermatitidis]KAJ4607054.1 hypothetical protein HRR84_000357 [Exophiala dermatitidis]KAJ4635764.1 hypothetical protein HRR86_000223 [Exophiala dermatitidis]